MTKAKSIWHPHLVQSPFCVLPFQGFFKPTPRKKKQPTQLTRLCEESVGRSGDWRGISTLYFECVYETVHLDLLCVCLSSNKVSGIDQLVCYVIPDSIFSESSRYSFERFSVFHCWSVLVHCSSWFLGPPRIFFRRCWPRPCIVSKWNGLHVYPAAVGFNFKAHEVLEQKVCTKVAVVDLRRFSTTVPKRRRSARKMCCAETHSLESHFAN